MLFFIRAYTFIRSSVSYFFTIILFFSPALLAFLVKDHDLYGRKDILFLGLLTIIMAKAGAIIIAPEKQGKAWLTIALCYLVAFLVHEITLFFSLLPALLVLRAGGRHRLPVLAAIGSVFLLSVLLPSISRGRKPCVRPCSATGRPSSRISPHRGACASSARTFLPMPRPSPGSGTTACAFLHRRLAAGPAPPGAAPVCLPLPQGLLGRPGPQHDLAGLRMRAFSPPWP